MKQLYRRQATAVTSILYCLIVIAYMTQLLCERTLECNLPFDCEIYKADRE